MAVDVSQVDRITSLGGLRFNAWAEGATVDGYGYVELDDVIERAGGAGVFDISAFGATNGSNVNTALQAAANAALAAGGGVVRIPAGWTVSTTVRVNLGSNVHVWGYGATLDASGITGGSTAYALYWAGSQDSTGVAVTADFAQHAKTITVASAASFAVGDLVQLRSAQPWDLSRGTAAYPLSEFHRVASVDTDADTITIEQRIREEWDNDTYPVTVRKITAVRNVSCRGLRLVMGGYDSQHNGIGFVWFDGAAAVDCVLEDVDRFGVDFALGVNAQAYGNRVSDTNHRSLGYGVMMRGVESGVMVGNVGERNRRSFEVNGGTTGMSRNIVIAGNVARNDRTPGIGSHAGTDMVDIVGNVLDGCNGGIIARGARHHIASNLIRDVEPVNIDPGIDEEDDIGYLDGITLSGVRSSAVGSAKGPAGPGGVVGAWRSSVIGNTIHAGCRNGIKIEQSDSDGVDILDNKIYGFTTRGIAVGRGADEARMVKRLRICRNHIDGAMPDGTTTGGYGIWLLFPFEDVTVDDNAVYNVTQAAIRATGSQTAETPNKRLRVRRNHVEGAAVWAVDVLLGQFDEFTCTDNTFYDCGGEIRAAITNACYVTRPIITDNHGETTLRGIVGHAAAVPAAGAWRQGDIVLNTAPAAAGVIGWVCVEAGSPGTWKTFGAIEP